MIIETNNGVYKFDLLESVKVNVSCYESFIQSFNNMTDAINYMFCKTWIDPYKITRFDIYN